VVLPEISVLSEVMVVVVTVPRDVLIVEDSMFVPSLEALALTEVITCVVPALAVLMFPIWMHGFGGGDDVEMFNSGISSKSFSFVSKLPLITTKTTISTLVSSLLLNSNHPGWGSQYIRL